MSTAMTTMRPKNVAELRQCLLTMLPAAKKHYPDLPINSSDIVMLAKSAERCPELLECSVPSVMGSLIEAKSLGWTIDGITGQAYLVPFSKKATLMPGYRGLIDLVRRSGQCEPSMDAIHDCDVWSWSGNTFDRPTFKAGDVPDRRSRPIVGAYTQGYFYNQGFTKTFYWPYQQIIAHRDKYSKAWQRSKKTDNPWHPENPGHWVMAAKTVLIDSIKRGLPVSQVDMRIIRRIESQDGAFDVEPLPTVDADRVADEIAGELTADPVTAAADPLCVFRADVSHANVADNLARKLAAFVTQNPELREQAEQIAMAREVELGTGK